MTIEEKAKKFDQIRKDLIEMAFGTHTRDAATVSLPIKTAESLMQKWGI